MNKLLFVFIMMVSCLNATPYRITNLAVSHTWSTKVTLTCTVPKSQSVIFKDPVTQIELRMDDSFIKSSRDYNEAKIVQVIKNPGVASTKVTFTVEGLKPDTRYYFACRAFDTKWNNESNVVSVKTEEAADDKIIRVKWVYKNDGGETPDSVIIVHGYTRAMTERPIAVTGSKFQADITGLKWGVPYYWQVTTVSADGEMTESPLRTDSK